MIWVIGRYGQWISEYRACFIEGHAMLLEIGFGFFGAPFEVDHRASAADSMRFVDSCWTPVPTSDTPEYHWIAMKRVCGDK
jgi:hypothetical protein